MPSDLAGGVRLSVCAKLASAMQSMPLHHPRKRNHIYAALDATVFHIFTILTK
jgi:hypothetical protein